ncbi:MAG: hypothetical protein Q8K91_01175 [Hylemonella sp.]|nr:hypothetical protein [Hylemonella sp.]MDP1935798.1 hypothetical protein [Hylemonella sp.]
MTNGQIDRELKEARKLAGGLLQAVSVFPSFWFLAMGMGGPNFQVSDLLTMFSRTDNILFAIAWVGVPVAGLAIGHLIKCGIRWSYFVGLLVGGIALFAFAPISTIFGVVLLFQLAKVIRHEASVL